MSSRVSNDQRAAEAAQRQAKAAQKNKANQAASKRFKAAFGKAAQTSGQQAQTQKGTPAQQAREQAGAARQGAQQTAAQQSKPRFEGVLSSRGRGETVASLAAKLAGKQGTKAEGAKLQATATADEAAATKATGKAQAEGPLGGVDPDGSGKGGGKSGGDGSGSGTQTGTGSGGGAKQDGALKTKGADEQKLVESKKDDLTPFSAGNPALQRPSEVVRTMEVKVAGDSQVSQKMVDTMVDACRVGVDAKGNAEVQFDLKGKVLGGLRMRITAEDGMVKAIFVAENPEVRKYVDANLQELQKHLEDRGIHLKDLEVRDPEEDKRQRQRDRHQRDREEADTTF